MSLKARLEKLEAVSRTNHVTGRAVYFIHTEAEPFGYVRNDLEITRNPGESLCDLRGRCAGSVTDDGMYPYFKPMQRNGKNDHQGAIRKT